MINDENRQTLRWIFNKTSISYQSLYEDRVNRSETLMNHCWSTQIRNVQFIWNRLFRLIPVFSLTFLSGYLVVHYFLLVHFTNSKGNIGKRFTCINLFRNLIINNISESIKHKWKVILVRRRFDKSIENFSRTCWPLIRFFNFDCDHGVGLIDRVTNAVFRHAYTACKRNNVDERPRHPSIIVKSMPAVCRHADFQFVTFSRY